MTGNKIPLGVGLNCWSFFMLDGKIKADLKKNNNKTGTSHLKSTILHMNKKHISMDHLEGKRLSLKYEEKITLDK